MKGEKLIEEVFEGPAKALDKAVETGEAVGKAIKKQGTVKEVSHYWQSLGPGLTTGAADDDPSGIATYSQTGARFGFQFLWLSLFTFPLMAIVQEMCARIGMVTGRGLAGNIRLHFPRWVIYVCAGLLFAANSFNIGADLGAMAEATKLVFPGFNFWWLLLGFTILSLVMQIFTEYERYAKYLKYLTFVLLSYIVTAFIVKTDWPTVFQSTIVPSFGFSKDELFIIGAVLGTTISPYLFFWQTSQEVEEEILDGKTNLQLRQETTKKGIKSMRMDVWSGMFVSNLVMFFIIAVSASVLSKAGVVEIQTAADAAKALQPLAGNFASLLFAIGIIGTGMLAVPVLAGSAAYAVSESMGWKIGLYRKLKQAYAFYGVIIISMIIGMSMNYIGIDPIRALLYSSVFNAVVAPVILVLIVLLSSNKKVMGEWANKKFITLAGILVTLLMFAAGAGAIYSLI